MQITPENISEVTAEIAEAFKAIHYLDTILHRIAAMMQVDRSPQDGKSTPESVVRLAQSIENRWKMLEENHMILTGERMKRVLTCEQIIDRIGFTVHNNVNHYTGMIGSEYGKDIADEIYDDIVKQANA